MKIKKILLIEIMLFNILMVKNKKKKKEKKKR
jgi:hypothetical protein